MYITKPRSYRGGPEHWKPDGDGKATPPNFFQMSKYLLLAKIVVIVWSDVSGPRNVDLRESQCEVFCERLEPKIPPIEDAIKEEVRKGNPYARSKTARQFLEVIFDLGKDYDIFTSSKALKEYFRFLPYDIVDLLGLKWYCGSEIAEKNMWPDLPRLALALLLEIYEATCYKFISEKLPAEFEESTFLSCDDFEISAKNRDKFFKDCNACTQAIKEKMGEDFDMVNLYNLLEDGREMRNAKAHKRWVVPEYILQSAKVVVKLRKLLCDNTHRSLDDLLPGDALPNDLSSHDLIVESIRYEFRDWMRRSSRRKEELMKNLLLDYKEIDRKQTANRVLHESERLPDRHFEREKEEASIKMLESSEVDRNAESMELIVFFKSMSNNPTNPPQRFQRGALPPVKGEENAENSKNELEELKAKDVALEARIKELEAELKISKKEQEKEAHPKKEDPAEESHWKQIKTEADESSKGLKRKRSKRLAATSEPSPKRRFQEIIDLVSDEDSETNHEPSKRSKVQFINLVSDKEDD